MTRVAVIGAGSMGRNHARVYREIAGAELVAVVDTFSDIAEQVARISGSSPYTDVAKMLKEAQPEAVTVAVPTQAHYSAIKRALEAGCHVLVEKPIAATLEEAEELVILADHLHRVLMVGHIERFNPA